MRWPQMWKFGTARCYTAVMVFNNIGLEPELVD